MGSSICGAASIALTGLTGTPITVEAALTSHLPGLDIIGLPDAALKEAKLRVRSATDAVGHGISERHITVNLSPAALPKQGSAFDLAIALAALATYGKVSSERLLHTAHIGELGLDGTVRRPAGLLPAVLAARSRGFNRVMVPHSCVAEARLVHGIEVIGVPSLLHAMRWHGAEVEADDTLPDMEQGGGALGEASAGTEDGDKQLPDMADVVGQADAVRALTVAAAGRHHISFIGPPGAGKTMLAERLTTILPDLTAEESLTATSIKALGGATIDRLVTRPPFVAPHHTASAVSIIGGGEGAKIRAGAVTHACHGVLFLDEAPEFGRHILDSLRQPLEKGEVEVHRSRVQASLPAKFQLVLAANPCPCGKASSSSTESECRCSPLTRVRYLQRISGPLADRIDIRLELQRVQSLGGNREHRHSSTALREQVGQARRAAAARLAGTPWQVNAEVPGNHLRGTLRLPESETAVINHALRLGRITLRGYDRILRVAWSIADLAGKPAPDKSDIAAALQLRGNM